MIMNAEHSNALHRVASRRFGVRRRKASITHTRGYHEFTERDKARMGHFSLDFTIIDNEILREHDKTISKFDHLVKTFGKWFICFIVGILTGLVAVGLKRAVESIQEIKFRLADHFIKMNYFVLPLAIFSSINMAFVFVSVLVIILVGPLAGGSGIPEVKGYLNGVRIPNSLNVKTLFGKLTSLTLSYSSGLVLGPEGPMLHIGAMVGAAVGQVKSKTFKWYPKIFWNYHNDRDRRDFITSGAGAGIAAAFGAPIGGVLFSIEEACSFWSRQVTWRTFFSCLVAVLTVNIFLQGFSMQMHDYGLLTFGFSRNYLYRYLELIPFTILGVAGGLLGALYVHLSLRLVKWRDENLHQILCYILGSVMPCRQRSAIVYPDTNVCDNNVNDDTYVQMYCKAGDYTDMGSLVFTSPDKALNILYSRNRHVFSVATLGLYSFFFFFLSLISTSGLWVASGIFVPTMLVGGSLGRAVGEIITIIFPDVVPRIDPSLYSMVGSAALLAGVSRMTISLVVIMMELTEGTQYLLPVILSVMVAKWVGDIFNESVYEHMMEFKCFPFLPTQAPRSKVMCTATEVMATDVVTFSPIEKVSNIITTLRSNSHNGFPIIDTPPEENKATLQALILRAQLIVLLEHKLFIDRPPVITTPMNYNSYRNSNSNKSEEELTVSINHAENERTQRVHPAYRRLTYAEFTQSLARARTPIEDITLTPTELEMYVDLRPYMNLSPITVLPHTCFLEVYRVFRTLGLRHMVVVDRTNVVVGMVTRKDLL